MKIFFEKPYNKLKLKHRLLQKSADSVWEQAALPIGNGSLGLSALGGVKQECITVNCKSFWTGGPSPKRPNYCGGNICGTDENGKTRADYFAAARAAFADGNDSEGSRLCDKLVGETDGYGAYQCCGEIQMDFDPPARRTDTYRRELDLDTAVSETAIRWKKSGKTVTETRTYFVSYPDNAAVLRIQRENVPLNLTVRYPAHHGAKVTADRSGLSHFGRLEDNGLVFCARLEAECDGTITPNGDALRVENASTLTLYFALDTDYLDNYPVYRSRETPETVAARVENTAKAAKSVGFAALLERHIADYRALYTRTSLSLGGGAQIPTDRLVRTYNKPNCDAKARRTLEELLYQYGRYLTISSSRETNVMPSNLQGIWNHSDTPAWSCDYHLNINLQMNYWPTFTANLSECATPLLRYVQSLCAPGRVTAAVYTGRESREGERNGFLFHTQNTPFGWTCPGWDFSWGWSPVAVAWILHNVYEIYEYTCDKTVLKEEIYPMLDEAADYFESLLLEKDGRLITSPCFSPEHGPRTAGNTYEQSMLWQLFRDVTQAAEALGADTGKCAHRKEILQKLRPIEIGESGQIKEWYHETVLGTIGQKHHRHLSHLLGLYPGNLIDRRKNPEQLKAAIVSLNDRGDKSTGWAMAQRICSRARTCEGDRALQLMGMLIRYGIHVNLWDVHPPFQIDGNFGFTAAVAELLMQSHTDGIDLLPALPSAWQNGEICGLVARGNFELHLIWKNGQLQTAEVLSRAGQTCRIAVENGTLHHDAENSCADKYTEDGFLVFPTKTGKTYKLFAAYGK